MKNVLLIGLGRFGRHIAMQLNQLGHEVMAYTQGAVIALKAAQVVEMLRPGLKLAAASDRCTFRFR